MRLKSTQQVNEAPMDFVRGAAKEVGNKVANSGPVRAGREIVQAGSAASAAANIEKAVAQLAALLLHMEKTSGGASAAPGQQEQPAQQQQQQPAQQQQKSPFQPDQKPRMTMKNGMQQYQFNSFLQAIHGEQIDEGIWDFVKGAGAAAGGKIRDKVNQYAAQPSVLKDIYAAGQKASVLGNEQKAQEKQAQSLVTARTQVKAQIAQILKIAKQLGDQAGPVVVAAIRKAGGSKAAQIMRIVGNNAHAQGINLLSGPTTQAQRPAAA